MMGVKPAFCVFSVLISTAAWPLPAQAACWNGKAQCVAIKSGGNATMHRCVAYSCGNVNGVQFGWTYPDGTKATASATTTSAVSKIDGKTAILLPESVTRKGYLCMTRPASDTYYCSIDLPH